MFNEGFAGSMNATVWGTFGRDGTINGILNKDGIADAIAGQLAGYRILIMDARSNSWQKVSLAAIVLWGTVRRQQEANTS